jgi:hypothetical protein
MAQKSAIDYRRAYGVAGEVTKAPREKESFLSRVASYLKGFGAGGDKPVIATGYEVGGMAAPTPTGKGTVMITPAITTQLEREKAEEFAKTGELSRIISAIAAPLVSEATTKANEIFNQYQQKVYQAQTINPDVNIKSIQEEYESKVADINKELNVKVEASILASPSYKTTLSSIGATQANIKELQKEQYVGPSEKLRQAEIAALKLTPFALPVTVAEQATQQLVYNPATKNIEYRAPSSAEALELGVIGVASAVQAGTITGAMLANLEKEASREAAMVSAKVAAKQEAQNAKTSNKLFILEPFLFYLFRFCRRTHHP